ncbi:MAG: hypothetical protein JSR64_17030 [Nitrospira sp.]|nr:hypothetical protein [Nitrospira sp.]
MTDEMKAEFLRLLPVVAFLTFTLVGVMVISAFYVDSHGIVSILPKADGDDDGE